MRNFKINTKLDICLPKPLGEKKASYFITRGATGNLTFDITSKAYTFNQIEQLIFVLQNADIDKTIFQFKMYDEEPVNKNPGVLNSHFKHIKTDTSEYINLELSSVETAAFSVTDHENLMGFEVVIHINEDDDGSNSGAVNTIIEPQAYINVIDSIYGHIIGD